ncbi:M23 family metallopeptidase [Paenibacillus filicis]|uniref:M23 family metallopeptidase n=1 Tax=Paenibacillus gyeongsangnamensis TaxID=3388067 RepID=A0ABT4QL83_9BACL|nr:M23 family metallopeptidase [Paenibacillus filicis]MCZ8517629.1 M23 family metallopeptidase [Paenibacillus filicis]
MTFFKGTDRIKELIAKVRLQGSGKRSADSALETTADPAQDAAAQGKPQASATVKIKNQVLLHKWMIVRTVTAMGFIAAVVWSGNQYVKANMIELVHVYANGQEIGVVSDENKVLQFEAEKKQQLSGSSQDVRMVVKVPEVTFMHERAFNSKADDQKVLSELGALYSAQPVGVVLLVDGKRVGVLRDMTTADKMLDQIKANAIANMQKKKDPGKVGILSASPAGASAAPAELETAEFVQKVELNEVSIDPKELVKPEDLQKKLETGDVQPTKYTVEKGDCVGCIAKKLNIPKQVIYQNNPSISDDMIKVGQQLDLTVLQPTLAVRTVEKVVENQEIQYETEYKQDDSMRLGTNQIISPGKNGLKKVTIELTKVNGLMADEKVLSEEVVQEPVKAVAVKGTKVVKGEGSGKFAWPVAGATITSTFGMRWGAFHKGVDLVGNRNITASDNGKVVFAGVKEGYGNCIIVDHMNGYRTLYGHLSQILTSNGKIVEKGEKIGIMGSTGDSTGVHLHFEVQRGETPDNPLKYLNR